VKAIETENASLRLTLLYYINRWIFLERLTTKTFLKNKKHAKLNIICTFDSIVEQEKFVEQLLNKARAQNSYCRNVKMLNLDVEWHKQTLLMTVKYQRYFWKSQITKERARTFSGRVANSEQFQIELRQNGVVLEQLFLYCNFDPLGLKLVMSHTSSPIQYCKSLFR